MSDSDLYPALESLVNGRKFTQAGNLMGEHLAQFPADAPAVSQWILERVHQFLSRKLFNEGAELGRRFIALHPESASAVSQVMLDHIEMFLQEGLATYAVELSDQYVSIFADASETSHKFYTHMQALVDQRRFFKADDLGKKYISAFPDDTRVASRLILSQLKSKNRAAGFDLIEQYQSSHPGDPHIADVQAAMNMSDPTVAIRILSPVIGRPDAIPRNFNLLAGAYRSTGQRNKAVETLTAAFRAGKFDSATTTLLSRLTSREQGMKLLREEISAGRGVFYIYHTLAQLCNEAGQAEESVQLLENIRQGRIPGTQANAITYLLLGQFYDRESRTEDAIRILETRPPSIQPPHSNGSIIGSLAQYYDKMGRTEQAIELLNKAIERKISYVEPNISTWHILAQLYEKTNRVEAGIRLLEDTLTGQMRGALPNEYTSNILAHLYNTAGKEEEGIRCLWEFIEGGWATQVTYHMLARTYVQSGDVKRGIQLMEDLVGHRIEGVNSNSISYSALAQLYDQAGRIEESLGLLNNLRSGRIADASMDSTTANMLARLYHRSGRTDEAIHVIEDIRTGKIEGAQPDDITHKLLAIFLLHQHAMLSKKTPDATLDSEAERKLSNLFVEIAASPFDIRNMRLLHDIATTGLQAPMYQAMLSMLPPQHSNLQHDPAWVLPEHLQHAKGDHILPKAFEAVRENLLAAMEDETSASTIFGDFYVRAHVRSAAAYSHRIEHDREATKAAKAGRKH